jgi:hypothetical protein
MLAVLVTVAGITVAPALVPEDSPVAAPAAEAACPTAHEIFWNVTWGGGSESVETLTGVVRCDNGTSTTSDDYYRLQWWRYYDSGAIRSSYGFNGVGNPIFQWQDDNGDLCNRINGYSRWYNDMFVLLGNQRCDYPNLFTGVGRADWAWGADPNFQRSIWR